MTLRSSLLVVMTFTACATTPMPQQEGHAGHVEAAATAEPISSGSASASVDVAPPTPAITSAVSVSAPVAVEAPDVCEDLVKLCHDVGHDGGVTGKCHQIGHARDDKTCKLEFSACKVACEAAAAKAAKPGAKKHAH